MTNRGALALFLLYLLLAPGLSAQPTPEGSEFRINTYTTGSQTNPDVATDPEGDFIVVWQSGTSLETGPDGDRAGVRGQRYASDGTALGSELAVNTYTTSSQESPSVATDDLGEFVVVWQSGDSTTPGPDGDGSGIQAQRFNSDGTPAGSELQVNSSTTFSQITPDVAVDGTGNFVVVWNDYDILRGRRFASDGTALDDEFFFGFGSVPKVARLAEGFVVVWTGPLSGNYAQRFASDGSVLGGELVAGAMGRSNAAVAPDSDGDFVVVWRNFYDDTIESKRFASDGSSLLVDFQVNTTTGQLGNPDVSSDAGGNFLAVWPRSVTGDKSIRGQRIASNGTFLGDEFQVNTTTGLPTHPAVASAPNGNLVVVWSDAEIRGQRFTPDESADVAISKDDGVDRVLPGAQVVYTIVAENLGPSFADPVTVTDVFAAELTCEWTSATAGGAAGNSSGMGDLSETLSLPAGSSVTYTVTCDVDVGATGTLTNTATISSPLPDPVPSNNSATDDNTRLRIADLSVTQADSPDPVYTDSPLTYTVQVANAGPEPVEDLRVFLVLPSGVAFVDATGVDWVCNGTTGVVICALPVLGVGSAPPLSVRVMTPSAETVLSLQVLVSAVELDPNPDDNISSELTTVIPGLIFSDGFESGDVSRWTVPVP